MRSGLNLWDGELMEHVNADGSSGEVAWAASVVENLKQLDDDFGILAGGAEAAVHGLAELKNDYHSVVADGDLSAGDMAKLSMLGVGRSLEAVGDFALGLSAAVVFAAKDLFEAVYYSMLVGLEE